MEQIILGFHVLPTIYTLLESLRKKVIDRDEDDFSFSIIDLDLYSGDPWDVFEDDDPWDVHNYHLQLSSDVSRSIYVFTELKYSGGQRYVRTAGSGTWDGATGDVDITENGVLIGTMRYLDFKLKEERDEQKRNGHWTMYEYKLAGEMLKGLEGIELATTLVLCEVTQILEKSLRIHLGWTKSVVDNYFDTFAKRGFYQKANNVDDGYNEFRAMTSDEESTSTSDESVADKSMDRDTNDRTNSFDESVADKTTARDTNDRTNTSDESVSDKSRTLAMARDTSDRTSSSNDNVEDNSTTLTMARDTNDSVADKSRTLTMARDTNDSVVDKCRTLTMARDTDDRADSFNESVTRDKNDKNGSAEVECMVSTYSNGDEANISRRNAPWVDPIKHQTAGTKVRDLPAFPRTSDGPSKNSANGVGKTGQLRKKFFPGCKNRSADGPSRIFDENSPIGEQNYFGYVSGAHGPSIVLAENVQLPKQIYPGDVASKRHFQGDVQAKVAQQAKRTHKPSDYFHNIHLR